MSTPLSWRRGRAPVALALLVSGVGWAAAAARPSERVDTGIDESRTRLLQDVQEQRDNVDPAVFEKLVTPADQEGLVALETAVGYLVTPPMLDVAFDAFRHFREGPLAEEALGFLAHESTTGYLWKERAAIRALAGYGSAARGPLEQIVAESEDVISRRLAVGGLLDVLRAQGTPKALALLIREYLPPTSGSWEAGVEALRAFSESESLEVFERALANRRLAPPTHAMIVEALAEMEFERAEKMLVRALSSKHGIVQLAAIQALERRGHAGHERQLERLLRSRSPAVKRAALEALARLMAPDDKNWIKKVRAAARSSDFALRAGSARALARFDNELGQETLQGLLADEHPAVRRAAIAELVTLRRKESVPLLFEMLAAESMRMRERLRDALALLTGEDHGTSPDRWRRFWEAEGADFVLPTIEEARARDVERRKRREANRTQASFYGIGVGSDRVCFILDTSGSMNAAAGDGGETRMDVLKRQLVSTLEGYPDGARFNLVFFSDRARAWKSELVAMDERTRQAAIRFTGRQSAVGGTALYDALMTAFDDPEVDTIFLLTDGEPTVGKVVEPDRILLEVRDRCAVQEVTIHSVSVNRMSRFLQELAFGTDGEYREVR